MLFGPCFYLSSDIRVAAYCKIAAHPFFKYIYKYLIVNFSHHGF